MFGYVILGKLRMSRIQGEDNVFWLISESFRDIDEHDKLAESQHS